MLELTKLTERVTKLETEMADIRDIAEFAKGELSFVPAVLQGHTAVLNSLRKTQREHSETLREHSKILREHSEGFVRMDENFARVDKNFATVEAKFRVVEAGIAKITELLTTAEESDEGP
jgi:hypothetical protein